MSSPTGRIPANHTQTSKKYCLDFPQQSTFLFSLIWSVGCTTDNNGRIKFDTFLRDILNSKSEEHPFPAQVGNKLEVPLPPEGLVYDYMYDVSNGMFCTGVQFVVSQSQLKKLIEPSSCLVGKASSVNIWKIICMIWMEFH